MTAELRFEIFLVAVPGLEAALAEEARDAGFSAPRAVPGGVQFLGRWRDAWRANLVLRGASRVLVRIGSFPAKHLSELDARAHAFPWDSILRRDVPVAVEASCSRSRIYHSGAAAERVARAIRDGLGVAVVDDAEVAIKLRIDNDIVTISLDSSGGGLHKRGHKQAMAKAPLRETMAALFLRQCGYRGTESVMDPMCGSGTLVIEAAEIAAGLLPGRDRSFAFEHLATFDAAAWQKLKTEYIEKARRPADPAHLCLGSDRDAGAIAAATANAGRAGVSQLTRFERHAVSGIAPPPGPPGLVILNPPYGARIGDRRKLHGLYGAIGKVLRERFAGWRVGLITSDAGLARATGLPLTQDEPVLHGGLRVYLFRSPALS